MFARGHRNDLRATPYWRLRARSGRDEPANLAARPIMMRAGRRRTPKLAARPPRTRLAACPKTGLAMVGAPPDAGVSVSRVVDTTQCGCGLCAAIAADSHSAPAVDTSALIERVRWTSSELFRRGPRSRSANRALEYHLGMVARHILCGPRARAVGCRSQRSVPLLTDRVPDGPLGEIYGPSDESV